MANPSPFPVTNSIQYLPVSSFTLLRTSSFVTLSSQPFFSILAHINISRLPIFFCLSESVSTMTYTVSSGTLNSSIPYHTISVHVSAAKSATLQTKHFIIFFFSSRLISPVNNFFFISAFFSVSILLQMYFS